MSTVYLYLKPSSVSVYLRVKVKSTIYVNPRLLVPGFPVQHRDNNFVTGTGFVVRNIT